jgi:hypothetical protein
MNSSGVGGGMCQLSAKNSANIEESAIGETGGWRKRNIENRNRGNGGVKA